MDKSPLVFEAVKQELDPQKEHGVVPEHEQHVVLRIPGRGRHCRVLPLEDSEDFMMDHASGVTKVLEHRLHDSRGVMAAVVAKKIAT